MKEPYIVSRVPVMQPKDTTGEILETIKYASWEELQQVFVIDTQQRLQGCIDLYQLLRCDATDNAGTLLKPCFAVSKKHSLEYAIHALRKVIKEVPITDEQGVFPSQTIIETLRKEHIEDLHKMASIRKESIQARKAVEASPLRNVRHRLPWLLAGLAGSFTSTYLMAGYEQILKSYLALSLSRIHLKKMLYTELRTGMLIGLY